MTLALSALCLAASLFPSSTTKTTCSLSYVSPPTPANGTIFHIQPGQLLTFTIQLQESDPNSSIGFLDIVMPPGAYLNPSAPLVAFGDGINPPTITTQFFWTPAADQLGFFDIVFDSANFPAGDRNFLPLGVIVDTPLTGCTYTQGGWGSKPNGANPGTFLKNNFAAGFPTGIEVGIPGAGGFSLKFTSSTAIKNFLPAGGTPAALKADATNPTKSAAGSFAGQVLSLALSVGFGDAGLTDGGPIGGLKLQNTGNAALDGLTIAQVLADANKVLGGGALPGWATSVSDVNDTVTDLNEAFDDCVVTAWATAHLTH